MLLETLVAISLISVVMAAFTTFFVNSVAFTSQQRTTQIATQIAESTVETIRALPASDVINGHDLTSVTAQFNAVVTTNPLYPWLSSMTKTTDPTALVANTGLTAAVPTAPITQTVNNIVYTVNEYVGSCVVSTLLTLNANCVVGTVSATQIGYLRAVVAVTWPGTQCQSNTCLYATSTLLSPVDDPLFNQNQSPPPAPVVTNPGSQTSAVGDIVNLTVAVVAVPTYTVTVTAGTLPAGLILTPASGLISGTPSAVTPSTSVTLTVTDGFGRTTTATFTWQVLPALTATAPANQASIIGVAITALTVTASGGSPAYTWSDPSASLPPGLSLTTVSNQARISGTPTTAGMTFPIPSTGVTFPVTLTVTDSTTTRKTTVSFTWTVNYPPFSATNPGPQTSTVGAPDTATLTVTGGSGSFAWTSATLPAGLTLTSAGVLSGTPTTAGVTSVTLTATDTKVVGSAQTFTISWTVYARPTVTSPGPIVRDVNGSVSLQLATTCPNGPCTYALSNGPSALGINATGVITGTLTTAASYGAVTVTVTDSAGGTGTSSSFAVTVNALPTVSNPGDQTVLAGSPDTLDVAALATGGTAPLTYSAVNLPSWLTLNTSTGAIAGTAPATSGTTTGIRLTVTDALGVSATSGAFNWAVFTPNPPSAPLGVTVVNDDGTITASWTAPAANGGSAVTGYTATLAPGGASCTTNGALTCNIGALTNGVAYSLTVKATNSAGSGTASTAVRAIPYPAGVMSSANGMTLWLDGADPSVLLGGSCNGAATTTSIACWKDKSGQSNDFTQATSANRPGVGSWNGLPAANFADSGDVLGSVNAAAQYQTVFFAANVTNPAGSGVIVNLFGQLGQDYNARIGSSADRRTQSSQNANDWAYNTGNPPQNWANGAQGANAPQPLAVITTDQSNSVKSFVASVSNTFGGRGVTGQVGDVITFNKVLTTAQRRSVEEYLAHKWGVAITPQAPTGITASTSGSTVTISWAPPVFDGGAAVTGYAVTPTGGQSCVTTNRSCTFTGAASGSTYTFAVTATNAVGTGPPSSVTVRVP